MAKFYGVIGYSKTVEEPEGSGIWKDSIIEKYYRGDILKNTRKWQSTDKVNDNITISNTISIVADSFAITNFQLMKYAKYMGACWKIESVEIERPRITLYLGGEYNGEQA